MIEGHVNERLEAIVSIEVYSSQGRLLTIDAILDTGFTECLTLPETFVHALGFDFKSNVVVNLANGESAVLAVGDATLRWGDADSQVSVFATGGPALIGMALLKEYDMYVEVLDGGRVAITPRSPQTVVGKRP